MKKIFIASLILLVSKLSVAQPDYKSNVANTSVASVRVIGNPTHDAINIQLNDPLSEKYDLSLYSLSGQKITSLSFTNPVGVSSKEMYLPQGLEGMYFLVATTKNGRISIKILIQ